MLLVVAYDIVDDRRRAAVASALKNYGQRVQQSVFECHLEKDEVAEMRKDVERLLDLSEDSVRYYRLCRKDEDNVDYLGSNVIYKDEDYFMV